MNRYFRPVLWPLLILPLLLAAALACTTPDAGETETPPTEAPPPTAMQAEPPIPLADFVSDHDAISSDWDQVHEDFDRWSASLSACHPDAMHEALNDFAVSFNDVTQAARELSRGETSGELADLLIVAAEDEETAFRQLRDMWQPNNVSLFESVEQSRAMASKAQKAAEDRAIEIRSGYQDAADPEATEAFQAAFEPVQADWEELHDAYESLKDDADGSKADAVYAGLEKHVAGLKSVIGTLEDLPELKGAEDTVEALQEAADAELEAFEAAVEAGSAKGSDGADDAAAAESSEKDDAAAEAEEVELPDFDALDEVVSASAKAIKSANSTIDDLADPDAEKGLVELSVFDAEYPRLVTQWDRFHQRYNDWRGTSGGCNRATVAAELNEFNLRMSQIARDVRGLPSAGRLLPIYSLLTEAASRDENALRTLRYTWQPFTLDTFKALHQERINTNGLRRQADIAVQELQSRS